MNALVKDLIINARYDLQAPFVLIIYESVSTVNGHSSLGLSQDFYPNPPPADPQKQFAALQFTVDLQGLQASVTTAKISCEPIAPGDPAWWLLKHPQYRPHDPSNPADTGNNIASFSIDPDSIQRAPNPDADAHGNPALDLGFTTELTTGQLTDWMDFQSQRVTLRCKATVVHRNGTQPQEIQLTFQCLSTNATSGAYTHESVGAFQEPMPVGLAKFIYDAISVLQYEGELVLQEEDVSGSLAVGQLFNLTGGALTEWETMAAMVQSITENIDTGATLVRFGPPRNLSAGDLVDLLRVNRSRLVVNVNSMRSNGTPGGGNGSVDLGENTPEKNSVSGTAPLNPHVISKSVDGTGPIIKHIGDALDCTSEWVGIAVPGSSVPPPAGSVRIRLSDAEGQDLFIQQLPICQNGVPGTMYFLCSNFVPDA